MTKRKSLVIVESPAKAKTINKYLGSNYIVKSSVGHIRDLARNDAPKGKKAKKALEKGPSALAKRLGFDPNNHWEAQYEIIPGKEKVVKELVFLAKNADHIYLAADLDREGEAIAWHVKTVLQNELDLPDEMFSRVTFNEITKRAIQLAFEQPRELDIHQIHAQQTRRFLDRLVGFLVSPVLWKKIARGLSAGRVQSVAVKLLTEREAEIKAFIPKEYWEIEAHVANQLKQGFTLKLVKYLGKEIDIPNEQEANKVKCILEQGNWVVDSVETKPTTVKPKAPFITSTLQQAAATQLGFGVKKTMTTAQKLYEAGHITYMRTDSTAISKDAMEMVRTYILDNYGQNYLPANPNYYGNKANAQEAHECIRCTTLLTQPVLENPDERKLYDLIRSQFIACQMVPAKYDSTKVIVNIDDYQLQANGRVVVFDGYTRVLPPSKTKPEERELPTVGQGEVLKLVDKISPQQAFTKPPARYNEASLVKELEKRGIGRPSTYAAIIGTIVDRGYCRLESHRFFAERIGSIVTDRLSQSFANLMDYSFTANMEDTLDAIAHGKADWQQTLDTFYQDLTQRITQANLPEDQGGMKSNAPLDTGISCPECQRVMMLRNGSTGVFLGCSGYSDSDPKTRCKKTLKLYTYPNTENKELYLLDRNTLLDVQKVDNQSVVKVIKGDYPLPEAQASLIECECDKCGKMMEYKDGRFGAYMGCSCGNTRRIKDGQVLPPKQPTIDFPELKCAKGGHFVLREGQRGVFLAASLFPKVRDIRALKVLEAKEYQDRLPNHLKFLGDAPTHDPEGLETIIRFSEKNQGYFITSSKDGKPTYWKMVYQDGLWQ